MDTIVMLKGRPRCYRICNTVSPFWYLMLGTKTQDPSENEVIMTGLELHNYPLTLASKKRCKKTALCTPNSLWLKEYSQSSPEQPMTVSGSIALPYSFSACTLISQGVQMGVPVTTYLLTLPSTVVLLQLSRVSFLLHFTMYLRRGP